MNKNRLGWALTALQRSPRIFRHCQLICSGRLVVWHMNYRARPCCAALCDAQVISKRSTVGSSRWMSIPGALWLLQCYLIVTRCQTLGVTRRKVAIQSMSGFNPLQTYIVPPDRKSGASFIRTQGKKVYLDRLSGPGDAKIPGRLRQETILQRAFVWVNCMLRSGFRFICNKGFVCPL